MAYTALWLIIASGDETGPMVLIDYTPSGGAVVGSTTTVEASDPRQTAVYGTRMFTFRYELLDSSNVKLRDLTNVLDCTVEQNWLAPVKRKARLTILADGTIDFLSQRIKLWVRLHLPPWGTDDWVEWPQGVFLLSTPRKLANGDDVVTREVRGYDILQVFLDDKVDSRHTVSAGTAYTSAVSTLLGSIPKAVESSASTLPTDREWEPGTPKLKIINDLLSAINYESLSFDENGTAVVTPYVTPADRGSEWTYADDEVSIMHPEVMQEIDLFDIANKWVLVVSDPDRSSLSSTFTNDDPASPTSTVRRGRTIVDFRTQLDAADQSALDAKVSRLAFEASQVFEAVEFTTGLNPLHSGNDVYRVTYDALAVDAKYSEHKWELPLRAGAVMRHRARRVVPVSDAT